MPEVEAEVEQGAGNGFAVDGDVLLFEMPAARTDDQHGGVEAKRVMLAGIGIV